MGLDSNVRQAIASQAIAPLRGDATLERMHEPEVDLRRLLMLVWRSKWLIALFAAAGIAIAYAQLLRVTPLYTAESRVLWEIDQTKIVDIDPVARSLGSDYFSLGSQIEVIKSGRLLERVVTELDLANDPVFNYALQPPEGWTRWLSLSNNLSALRAYLFGAGDRGAVVPETPDQLTERLIATVRGSVEAEWLDSTYVLIIRATTSDAQRSATLANAMAKYYILDQLETKFDATRQATDWLTERVADLRVSLQAAEKSVEDFSSGMSLVSEEALAVSARQLKDLRERAETLAEEQSVTGNRLRAVNAGRSAGQFASIAALMREPQLARLADDIDRIKGAGDETARQQLLSRFDAALGTATGRMEVTVERLRGQEATVRQTIAELEAKQEDDARSLVQLRELQREAEASRLIYEFFLARLKETSVQEGIQRPDARILTEAQAPLGPSSPRRGFTLMAGGGAGVLLALTMILLSERLNTSFRSTDELERLTGEGVIGTIPMAPFTRRRAFLDYLIDKPTSNVAEAIRNLRTSVLLANVDQPPQVILLASALPGEGKTTCCIGLAQISRALGKRVLLVECDVRRRTFQDYFDLPDQGGLLSLLSGARAFDEVVHFDQESGLHILPGESSAANAADVFASQRFSEFIDEMRDNFDFIFIDTPPVLAVPDARVIAKSVDAVLFCVRWNKTAREIVIEGLRFFAQVNVRIAGLVLSQVNISKMARYGYSTYRYYRDTSRYYHN